MICRHLSCVLLRDMYHTRTQLYGAFPEKGGRAIYLFCWLGIVMMYYHYEYHVHGDAPIWHTHYKATYL